MGRRDVKGRYKIPLIQQPDHQQALNVYDLPTIEEAVRWMHASCGYPVKSTWIKAIKAGNFLGWPIINIRTVSTYYPETQETPKGHLNQTRKNVRSTKTSKHFNTIKITRGNNDEAIATSIEKLVHIWDSRNLVTAN